MKRCVIVPNVYNRYVVTVRYVEGVLSVLCYAPTSSDALDAVAVRHPHAISVEVSLSNSK